MNHLLRMHIRTGRLVVCTTSYHTKTRKPNIMSFLPQLRSSLSRSTATAAGRRAIATTPRLRTTAGYGDPQDEKAANHTPTPGGKSSTDQQMKSHSGTETAKTPAGQGKGGAVRSAGGKSGAGDQAKEEVTEKDIKETKKIGEEPKNTEEGGAGPKGG